MKNFNSTLNYVNELNKQQQFKILAGIVNNNEFDNKQNYDLTNEQSNVLNELIVELFGHNDELFMSYDDTNELTKYQNSIFVGHETFKQIMAYVVNCTFEQQSMIYNFDCLGFECNEFEKQIISNYIVQNFKNNGKSLKN